MQLHSPNPSPSPYCLYSQQYQVKTFLMISHASIAGLERAQWRAGGGAAPRLHRYLW